MGGIDGLGWVRGSGNGDARLRSLAVWWAQAAKESRFDLIFLDPPYEMNPLGALAELAPVVAPDGVLVLEHARGRGGPADVGGLARAREVTSGSSALSLYRWAGQIDPGSQAV